MLPTVRDHGLVEPKVLNPSDQMCTPTQSTKLAPRIDVGINDAPVEHVAIGKPLEPQTRCWPFSALHEEILQLSLSAMRGGGLVWVWVRHGSAFVPRRPAPVSYTHLT